MKKNRHAKIVELIEKQDIETQEELANCLIAEGFQVTQATVSRDIRELGLSKIGAAGGRQKYALLSGKESELSNRHVRVLKEGFESMDMAQNILVIKTVSGMAMAVAAALDALKWKEIVGCIAGDDTIMCAVRSVEETRAVMEKLRKIIKDTGFGRE